MMHAAAPATPSRLNEYYELCKPRVVMLIVFTAVVGMFLAVPGLPPWGPFVWGTLGIGLQASSAAALNQIIDRNIDARLARTCGRPLVTGRLQIGSASCRETRCQCVSISVVAGP